MGFTLKFCVQCELVCTGIGIGMNCLVHFLQQKKRSSLNGRAIKAIGTLGKKG